MKSRQVEANHLRWKPAPQVSLSTPEPTNGQLKCPFSERHPTCAPISGYKSRPRRVITRPPGSIVLLPADHGSIHTVMQAEPTVIWARYLFRQLPCRFTEVVVLFSYTAHSYRAHCPSGGDWMTSGALERLPSIASWVMLVSPLSHENPSDEHPSHHH